MTQRHLKLNYRLRELTFLGKRLTGFHVSSLMRPNEKRELLFAGHLKPRGVQRHRVPDCWTGGKPA